MPQKFKVLARLRPFEELPEWALCCDPMRKTFREQVAESLEVVPSKTFVAEVECPFCGRVATDRKYVRLVRRGGKYSANCIPVECYEFDEGAQEIRTQNEIDT